MLEAWPDSSREARVMDRYFLAHSNSEVLATAASVLADFLEGRLGVRGLMLARPKCRNLLVSPGRIIGQAFRRKTGYAETYRRDLKKNDVLREHRACAAEDAGDIPPDAFPIALRKKLPYEYSDPLSILGVWRDGRLRFAYHIKGVLGRATVRHGIMARLARSPWGLETGALKATHSAMLLSFSGFALATAGSGAYDEGLRSLEVQLANISARRIVGIGRLARIAALRMTAGVTSVQNQYSRKCALLLE